MHPISTQNSLDGSPPRRAPFCVFKRAGKPGPQVTPRLADTAGGVGLLVARGCEPMELGVLEEPCGEEVEAGLRACVGLGGALLTPGGNLGGGCVQDSVSPGVWRRERQPQGSGRTGLVLGLLARGGWCGLGAAGTIEPPCGAVTCRLAAWPGKGFSCWAGARGRSRYGESPSPFATALRRFLGLFTDGII